MENKNKIFIGVSIAIYFLCLTQATYYTRVTSTGSLDPGWMALLFGWLGLLVGVFAWLGNIFLFISWYEYFKEKYLNSLVWAVLALFISLSFLLYQEILTDEGGGKSPITGYGLGYWLWLISELFTVVSATIALTSRPRQTPQNGAAGL